MAIPSRNPGEDDDDLDLPPLDGEDEKEADVGTEELDVKDDGGDAFDDSTADHVAMDELQTGDVESGLLVGAEESAIEVPFDLALADEGKVEADDEPDGRAIDEDLATDESLVTVDGGEEGPTDEDEELREEDLPALDADEDGDVDEDGLYDRAILGTEEELRWDDRAWARVPDLADGAEDLGDDSGTLAVPGEDPRQSARDKTWKELEETGRLTAAVLVPNDAVVVALDAPERPVLVRIDEAGVARIIAEVEGRDDSEPAKVIALRWDQTRGWLIASGTFGVQAFRPEAPSPAPVVTTTPV
jgi:hypothetical protein